MAKFIFGAGAVFFSLGLNVQAESYSCSANQWTENGANHKFIVAQPDSSDITYDKGSEAYKFAIPDTLIAGRLFVTKVTAQDKSESQKVNLELRRNTQIISTASTALGQELDLQVPTSTGIVLVNCTPFAQ